MRHFDTVSWYHCVIVLLYQCIIVSLYQCSIYLKIILSTCNIHSYSHLNPYVLYMFADLNLLINDFLYFLVMTVLLITMSLYVIVVLLYIYIYIYIYIYVSSYVCTRTCMYACVLVSMYI